VSAWPCRHRCRSRHGRSLAAGATIALAIVVGCGPSHPGNHPIGGESGPLFISTYAGGDSLAEAGHYDNASLIVLFNRGPAPIRFDSLVPDVHGSPAQAKILAVYLPLSSAAGGPSQCAGCPGANDTGGGPRAKPVGWPPLGGDGPLPVVPPKRIAPMTQVRNIGTDGVQRPALLLYGGLLLGSDRDCATIDGIAARYHTQNGRARHFYAQWFPFQWAVCPKETAGASRRLDQVAQQMRVRVGRKVIKERVQLVAPKSGPSPASSRDSIGGN
jgi:hypothetical protein